MAGDAESHCQGCPWTPRMREPRCATCWSWFRSRGIFFSENRLVCAVLRRRKNRCEPRIIGPLRCRALQDFGWERLAERRETGLLCCCTLHKINSGMGVLVLNNNNNNNSNSNNNKKHHWFHGARCSVTVVLFLNVNLTALRWICLSCWMSFLGVGSQAQSAYSRMGLTTVLWVAALTLMLESLTEVSSFAENQTACFPFQRLWRHIRTTFIVSEGDSEILVVIGGIDSLTVQYICSLRASLVF